MCYTTPIVSYSNRYFSMKLLLDFLPIVLFFIAFKLFGIYIATSVAMIASCIQVGRTWTKTRKVQLLPLLTLGIIVVLGSATLFFHNPLFIKWKPTVVYWTFGIAFLVSPIFSQKNLIQRLLEPNITLTLPEVAWSKLNWAWAFFFLMMGSLNLYVAYHYTTNTWVNFKLFGGFGLTLLFILLQALYLSKHAALKNENSHESNAPQ